ncbi:MAG: TonB-dependent receptor [Bacteroidales bacterium]|nr:TonB-dependent receptor [Bacteroidales bacterium]
MHPKPTAIKFLAKINWNINDKHKLTLRHSYTFGENIDISRGQNALRFYNHGVYFPSTTNSTGLELNSIFNTKMANRLLVGYTRVRDDRDPLGNPFSTILINLDGGKTITVGNENSSVANQLDQDIISFDNDFNLYLGRHTLTFGTHNEMYRFYNLFVQNIYGNYAYKTLANFESIGTASEVAPTFYGIGYSFANDDNPSQSKGAAEFTAFQLGLYAQDEFQLTKNLQVTAGLRVDIPIFPDKPESNADFNTAYASQEVSTGTVPESKLLWSPRIGFNWDVFNNKSLQVRGGTGLFTGRVPFVWVSNQFSNNGQLNGAYSVGGSSSSSNPIPPIGPNSVVLKFTADPYGQPLAENLGQKAGRGAINVIDKNFKFPQVLRSNIAIDKTLPFGIVATIEGIFSKTLNNINFTNLNRQADPNFVFSGPDQRPRYTSGSSDPTNRSYVNSARINSSYEEIVKLNNTNDGYAYNFVFQLQRAFKQGFQASAAYTFGESMDLNSGTSSVAYSNWRYVNNVHGLNDLRLSTSNFSTRSRIIGFVSYRKDYLGSHMSSHISLFYSGQSGQPLSYIYDGDLNNDGTSNDLIYVPRSANEINLTAFTKTVDGNSVTVTPQEQWEQLNAFIENDKYLKNRRGEYAHRNAANSIPFQHQFDLRLQQEFNLKTGTVDNKLQITFDIINVGNLINKDWGRQYYASNQQISLIRFVGLYDSDPSANVNYSENKPMFNYNGNGLTNGKPYSTSDLGSRWRAQIGVRYIF